MVFRNILTRCYHVRESVIVRALATNGIVLYECVAVVDGGLVILNMADTDCLEHQSILEVDIDVFCTERVYAQRGSFKAELVKPDSTRFQIVRIQDYVVYFSCVHELAPLMF